MGKYDPLQQFLQQSTKDEITLTFDEVEHLLESSLPDSAYKHNAWWANNDQPHVQASAWLKVGWKVDNVDQMRNRVKFRRMTKGAQLTAGTPMTPLNIEPVTLEGRYVRLEPLSMDHHAALTEIGLDEDLWRWVSTNIRTAEDMQKYIELALKMQSDGSALPFATIDKASNRVVGSTRFGNIEKANRGVEIGWTWVGKPWQRTAINTEAKYLMLTHAFEVLGCIRVALKTDVLNEKSRNAIARLGAKQEGIFRNHMIMFGGRVRDSVWFSITDTEWPAVKAGLEEKLARQYAPR